MSYEPTEKVIITRNSGKQPPGCEPQEVAGLLTNFFAAFNEGDEKRLDRFFRREPGFEWYSVTEGDPNKGGRHFVTYERSGLLPYFAHRHNQSERLELLTVDVGGGFRTVGIGFVVRREAADLANLGVRSRTAHGKGEIDCREQKIFVWSMGMPKEAESPEWSCPKPSGWTPNGPIVACTRGVVDGGEPSLAGPRPTKGYDDYCAAAPGCEGEVPYPLRRALHLPKIDHGEPCPTSPRQQVSAAFAPALGTGPVYPVGFSARAALTFEYPPPKNGQFAGSAWGGQKVLWVSDPGYEGPILIRVWVRACALRSVPEPLHSSS